MKNILITGGNRGLGLGIIKRLNLTNKYNIFMGTRSLIKGEEAILKNNLQNINLLEIDIDNFKIKNLKNIKFDILINNAGINLNDIKNKENCKQNILTNYINTIKIIKNSINFLNKGGLIINISSLLGTHLILKNNDFRKKILDFDEEKINLLLENYYNNYEELHRAAILKKSYSFSKLLLSLWNYHNYKFYYENYDIKLFSTCPGWIKTDMGGETAPGTVEDGVDKIISLINKEDQELINNLGLFYQNYKFENNLK